MKYEDEDAERQLIERDPVAYEHALRDPEFRSVFGAPLPDRFYVYAAKQVRRKVWAQREATLWLSRQMHLRSMRRLSDEVRERERHAIATGHRWARLDAAMLQCVKDGVLVGAPALLVYINAPALRFAAYAGFAYLLASIAIAWCSRRLG